MKVRDSEKDIDGAARMIKTYNWNSEEISIELNATENECDTMCGDPRGDVIQRTYKPEQLKQAFDDFMDVVKKDYDEAYLSIFCYINKEAAFTVTIDKKEITVWATIDVTPSDIYTKKLAKIEQIIKE